MTAGGPDTLILDNLVAGYGGGDVLRGVSFGVPGASITAVIGPNGAGKSTVLATIVGLLRPRSGRILLDGKEITGISPLQAISAGIVIVPQARSLFPNMTVDENVNLGGYTVRDHRVFAERRAMIDEIVTRYAKQRAGRLSGGQQRVVEFARCLMLEPGVVLLDEPSIGLDPAAMRVVYDSILRMRESGKTVVLVEQNAKAALEVADKAVLLEAGRVRLAGPAQGLRDHAEIGSVYLGSGAAKMAAPKRESPVSAPAERIGQEQ
jgi:ABC-type branched-subunit amino acid transport system ATPase component